MIRVNHILTIRHGTIMRKYLNIIMCNILGFAKRRSNIGIQFWF